MTRATWEEFAHVARVEAAARNLRFLALGALLIVIFTLFDIFVDSVQGRDFWLRILNNTAVLAIIVAIALVLRSAWGRDRVFGVLFALCATVLIGQAFLLGVVSAAPGRLAFHFLAVLGLTMAGVQWFWPWQAALGVLAVVLVAAAVPASHPDYGFFLLSLSGSAVLATAFGRALVLIRYEQFATNERLRRTSQDLAHHSAQLQAKNAEMKDLFYVLSHDLRAPLINLEGFADELVKDIAALEPLLASTAIKGNGARSAWPELRDNMNESLRFIRQGVAKMGTLVRGILQVSRLEAKAQEAEPVELGEVVRQVLGSLQYKIAERGIVVDVGPLPTVVGDSLRLNQLFGNLIDNSIKYMKPDGEARIEVRCRPRDERYEFSVRDSGVGIRREDHDRIFRLFSRVGANGAEGEGIGLAAVKKIVERHGGTIWVDSELGEGTAISFTLPGS